MEIFVYSDWCIGLHKPSDVESHANVLWLPFNHPLGPVTHGKANRTKE